MKNTNRRHATRNTPRDASYISSFSYEDLVVFKQSQIRKIAYVVPLRSLRATEDVPRSWSGLPGPFFAAHCATAAQGVACWLGFWSRSRESKSNNGVYLKFQAFVNFAFLAAKNSTPSLTHSFTPKNHPLSNSPGRRRQFCDCRLCQRSCSKNRFP